MDFNKENALKELEKLNKQAQEASKLLAEANGKKKIHEETVASCEKELRDMGINPNKIDETLEAMINEYNSLLEEAKSLIPTDILERAKKV